MEPKFILILLLAVGLVPYLLWRLQRISKGKDADGQDPIRRLQARLKLSRSLLLFVRLPPDMIVWRKASLGAGDNLVIDDGSSVPLESVVSYVVAYPSGEILDCFGPPTDLPPELHFMEERSQPEAVELELTDAELTAGVALLKIEHLPSKIRPGSKDHYETRLTNLSTKRLQVLKFGGFARTPRGTWTLNTVTRALYDQRQFCEWYDLDAGGWLEPGQSVKDPDNYGARKSLWAYFAKTDDGVEFTAGAVVE